jgi:hypothetical protein
MTKKGYKGFYKENGKLMCRDTSYEVGKTYATNRVEVCDWGIHYCKKLIDVLGYYTYKDNLVICEVEDIGDQSVTTDKKTATNKLKIVREVKALKSKIKSRYKFDKNNNLIYEKDSAGNEWFWKYDKNNNKIYKKNSAGDEWFWKYDKNNNKIYKKNSAGDEWYLVEEE